MVKRKPNENPAKIATPPRMGIVLLCTFLKPGGSLRFLAEAIFTTVGIASQAISIALTDAKKTAGIPLKMECNIYFEF
jgi:hypothetical protein